MAEEDKKGLGSRILGESLGRIKESLGVSRETQGFGEVMKQGFSAANMFGADSFLGSALSSDEERERVANFSKDKKRKERETANTGGSVSEGLDGSEVAEILKKVQEDVNTIREIKEEEFTAPVIKDPVKLGNEQLDVNKKILATLQAQEQAMTKPQGAKLISLFETALARGGFGGGGGGGGPGILPVGTGMFSKGKDLLKSGVTKAKTFGKGLFKGGLGGAARFAGPAATVGLGAYEAVSGANQAESDLESLEISAEEAQSRKGESIGSGVGGASAGVAGMLAGAAIGSAVPIVGTVIGGMIGGALGYFAGSAAGGAAGEAIADAIPVSEEDLNESNQLANDYLDSISEKEGGSELVTKIKAEATEIESKMMEATGKQPEELSENDIEAIANAALIKSIQNNEEEALTIAGYSASEQQNMMDALEDTASGSAGGPKVGDVVSMEKIRALANKDGGLGYAPALDEDGDEIPGQYEITRLGNSKRGLEIPDGQITSTGKDDYELADKELERETFLQDYDKAKQNQETAEQKLADFEAEFGAPDTKETRSFGLAGDVEFDVYSDPELQARAEELRKAANVAKNERNALLNKEKKRTGGSEKDKFRAIQESTGMSEDEVLATIGGEKTENGRTYSQGKLDALFTAQTEQNLSEETKSLQDRKMSAEIDNSLEQEVAEIDNSLNQELSDAVIADNAMRELTPKELQEEAEEIAAIEAAYESGRNGTSLENANASTVESATMDAADAEKAGSQQPIVVQAPTPTPAPKQDVNVVVSIPKTIGPDTASGSRQLRATSFT